jgi:mono/diheme cytochrome c family protein
MRYCPASFWRCGHGLKATVPTSLSPLALLVGLGGGLLSSVWLVLAAPTVRAAEKAGPGLALTVTALDAAALATDSTIAPNVWLYVEAGKSPTPFLPAGRFSAIWEGFLNAELRSDLVFQAELSGGFKLEINGQVTFETSRSGGASAVSASVRLNKGPNPLKATFTSPPRGDAWVRLSATEKGTNTSSIPLAMLTHAGTPALQQAARLRLGRELLLEHRCAKCHAHKLSNESLPELSMDGPSLEGIGSRRNFDWMARWILDPKAQRASANMPKLLRGQEAARDAEAIAAFLASLKSNTEASFADSRAAEKMATPALNGERKHLFEKLHCGGCHTPPEAKEIEPGKSSVKHVAEKFSPGKLAEFLRKPEAHYAWIRMPNFNLAAAEAKALADLLLAAADPPSGKAAPEDQATLERGKRLVQTSGCLNCHDLKLENKFSAPRLAELAPAKWQLGCLAAEAKPDSHAPQFGFTMEEREALQAFGGTDRASLARHVPAEFAERQARALNCAVCHGQIDGVPPVEVLGGKLKPEWAARFIGGAIPYKPRAERHPGGDIWLEARMPVFKSRAELLARGLAAQHGYPQQMPPEPPIDRELARIGQQLVGKAGGFSCVSCHGVGSQPATEVFESEGVNFAYAAERLLPDYYRRWLRSPTSIEPQTKMPVYFDEGRSPLTEVLDGDAEKQIDAIWQYLRLGRDMPPPRVEN